MKAAEVKAPLRGINDPVIVFDSATAPNSLVVLVEAQSRGGRAVVAKLRTKMRVAVKRILRKHGFPPDLQDGAIKAMIRQAEALAQELQRAA